ncbi:MAG: replication protein RepA [Actinomycetota bacterium]
MTPPSSIVEELFAPPGEGATVDKIAYAPSLFAQLALPYRDPGDLPRWHRTNGAMTLVVNPGVVVGADGQLHSRYPFGVIPRLVLIWIATEVTLPPHPRELYLGASLAEFVTRLGLLPRHGGPRSDRVRVVDQVHRLLSASMVVTDRRAGQEHAFRKPNGDLGKGRPSQHTRAETFTFARAYELWEAHDDRRVWEGALYLSEEFYDSLRRGAFPVSSVAIAELRLRTRSPLALDIYMWLAHRLHRVDRPTVVPWAELAVQFGGTFARVRDFKAQFLAELAHVLVVYPKAKVAPEKGGLRLSRSPAPVPPRSRRGQ